MLIHEQTVMRAAETDISTRSYIKALFFVAFDDFVPASDIVNLFVFLVDNRKFTLMYQENQYEV